MLDCVDCEVSLGEPGKQVWYVDLPVHHACTALVHLHDDVDEVARSHVLCLRVAPFSSQR